MTNKDKAKRINTALADHFGKAWVWTHSDAIQAVADELDRIDKEERSAQNTPVSFSVVEGCE